MEMTEAIDRLKDRNHKLWSILNSCPSEEFELSPLKPEEFKTVIESIDSEQVVETLQSELNEAIMDLKKESCKYTVLTYSWSYDGSDFTDNATGVAFENCTVSEYAETDLIKLGSAYFLEREKPQVDGNRYDLGYLSINLVMDYWYDDLITKFMDLGDDFIIKQDEENPAGIELMTLYDELFNLKLFLLTAEAYNRIQGEKPQYLFIKKQDRWPVLLAG